MRSSRAAVRDRHDEDSATPTMDAQERRQRHWQVITRLWPELWQFKGRICIAFVCLVLAKAANIGVPVALKYLVEHFDAVADTLVLTLPILLLATYGLLRFSGILFNELRNGFFARVSQRVSRAVSRRVFSHLHQLSLRFHLERQTGGISRDLERGSRAITSLLSYMVFAILPTIVELIIVILFLTFALGPLFTAFTLGTIVVYFVFTWRVTHWRTKFRVEMNNMESRANTSSVDALLNYETVKYFGNEQYEENRFDKSLKLWEDASIKSQLTLAMLNTGQGFIIALGLTAVMYLASRGVLTGELTLGDFVMVNAFLIQLYIPLNFLGTVVREVNHGLVDMERMFTLLDENSEIEDRPNARPLLTTAPRICFEDVHFAYNPDRKIIKGVSFTIEPGQTVAVVGDSGSGKSTLGRLLFRFFDVDRGVITIDGTDIRDLTLASLRRAIGVVPQDTVLFNDTIGYNIAYGKPDGSEAQVDDAMRLAYLDNFVKRLPQGKETLVGERGLKVSGGEKQRIAIARTILKNPPALILDEATSALDSNAERAIQGALDNVAQQRTVLVISHRLSTIVNSDVIIVLNDGQIAERGTHSELLALEGHYANLWALQKEDASRPDRGQLAD